MWDSLRRNYEQIRDWIVKIQRGGSLARDQAKYALTILLHDTSLAATVLWVEFFSCIQARKRRETSV